MTKTEMLDFIEKTGMIIDFDRNYLMRKTKDHIIDLYNRAVVYAGKAWAAALVRLRCNTSNYSIDKYNILYYNIDNKKRKEMIKMTIREWLAKNPTMIIDEVFSNYGDSRCEVEDALDEDIVEVYYYKDSNIVDIEF